MQEFSTKQELIAAAAARVSALIVRAIDTRGRASLMCSGGSTPGPIYAALSHAGIDRSKLVVGLADERWVPADHPASNARLVRNTLFQGMEDAGNLHPMGDGVGQLQVSDAAETAYQNALPTDVLILGMGPDGHTLSWFPGADGLEVAMDPESSRAITALRAQRSDVTGDNTDRLTLTAAAVKSARHALLLITGDTKRTVWNGGVGELPVHHLPRLLGDRLTVFWAP